MNETQRKKHKAREKRETKKGIRQTENDEQNGRIKYFPIAISDINGLNSQIQRHRVAKWTKKKKNPTTYCLQDMYFRITDTHRLKVRGLKDTPCRW